MRIAERYERYWGKKADGALCVTKAMQAELQRNWSVPTTVFYDRPPEFFREASLREKHEALLRLESSIAQPMHAVDFAAEAQKKVNEGDTLCTRTSITGTGGSTEVVVCSREDRPAIVVTSTSWTPDEDFGLLLAAAQIYDTAAAASNNGGVLPRLLIFVTGRGPQRTEFEARMKSLHLSFVAFRTVWLAPEDYPLLLGSSDLGVSLHSSSSGLDLPMKVVDMFGAGLPVCALSYSCIGELVAHGRNGLLFSTAAELAACLQDALTGFPNFESNGVLMGLKRGVVGSSMTRWHDSWMKIALPVLVLQGSTTSTTTTASNRINT